MHSGPSTSPVSNVVTATLKADNKTTTTSTQAGPTYRTVIVGAGIIGRLEAYYSIKQAKARGIQLKVDMFEKNANLFGTTAANNFPSLTPDEGVSVIPNASVFPTALKTPFNEPRGIKVIDVKAIGESASGRRFVDEALKYGEDKEASNERTETLLALGRLSMNEWKNFYDEADPELQQILRDSNFKLCKEPVRSAPIALNQGYRIDLMFGIKNATKEAENMKASYEKLDYMSCKVLSPDEVVALDPSLKDFCESHSEVKDAKTSVREWKNDSAALYRPGGCIDSRTFLSKFDTYLAKLSGEVKTADGKSVPGFEVHYNHKVEKVNLDKKENAVVGLEFSDSNVAFVTPDYRQTEYIFCPGEAVNTLSHVGFVEPIAARFAGASLRLEIPFNPEEVSAEELARINSFNHCMEVHKVGVVLAWQARTIGNTICIGVAGTKSFYADQEPHVNEAFAVDRNLLQLNMINDVLPQFISRALGRNTRGQTLTLADLSLLEERGMARRWVGSRAVYYDNFPTFGPLYNTVSDTPVLNARVTTGLGSGGVAYAHGAIKASRAIASGESNSNPLLNRIGLFSDSRRSAMMRAEAAQSASASVPAARVAASRS